MIANQYQIVLPADYDMSIIRRRVSAKGSTFDGWPDLLFKAFLISERSEGAPVNQYSPFYMWNDTGGLWTFLAGAGFDGITTSFGRPRVLTWLPWAVELSPDLRREEVRAAIREDNTLPLAADLPALRRSQLEESRAALADDPGIAAQVAAVNTETWTSIRFTLRYDRPSTPPPDAHVYEVLHLSGAASNPSGARRLERR
jgi:uncharacterized protein DUF4865